MPENNSATMKRGSSWLETWAHFGYAARGGIYVVIGTLAVLAAFGRGGDTEGTKGALRYVLNQPGGWIIVALLAIGLVGYASWRFCQAAVDADQHGTDPKGLAIRAGLFASGVTHTALAIWAGSVAFGYARSAGGENTRQDWVAWLMAKPFGQWLVALAGIVVIGVGVAQFLKGHKRKFEKRLTWSAEVRKKLSPVCAFGLYARGVVFAILGGFVVYAAIKTDPSQAGGLKEALDWLRVQAYGPWLLGIVAIGLFAFGVYSIVEAIYRKVDVELPTVR